MRQALPALAPQRRAALLAAAAALGKRSGARSAAAEAVLRFQARSSLLACC